MVQSGDMEISKALKMGKESLQIHATAEIISFQLFKEIWRLYVHILIGNFIVAIKLEIYAYSLTETCNCSLFCIALQVLPLNFEYNIHFFYLKYQ